MKKEHQLKIRNSTAEFLIFTRQTDEDGIEVRVEDETVWLTQKLMAMLFEVTVPTINEHLAHLYTQEEIEKGATIRNFRIVQNEGGREVARNVDFYNLDAIIAVGFRVNSARAIQFRQWATVVLRDYAIRGYVLDKECQKNGAIFSKEYFENLPAEIREIRASERKFYQKITDIYATAMDYRVDAETTRTLFATVQNKLHFAIHGRTAAELIVARADSTKDRAPTLPLTRQLLIFRPHFFRHPAASIGKLGGQHDIGDGENLRGEEAGVVRAVDGDRGDRDAFRHLHDSEQRVQAPQTGSGGRDRDADDWQDGVSSHDARQVGGAAGAGNHHAHAALCRAAREVGDIFRRTVRTHHVHFIRDIQFLQRRRRLLHNRQIGIAAHQDSNQGGGHLLAPKIVIVIE